MARMPRVPLARIVRSSWLPWAVAGAMAVLAATFLGLWRAERAEDARRAEAERTAGALVIALTNFSGETIERDVAEIRSYAVGAFAEEVAETFTAERLDALRDGGVRSTGELRSVFLQTLEGSTATAFVVVDETTTNRASPEPRNDVLRIEVGLIETTDGWRVNDVEILQSPGEEALVP